MAHITNRAKTKAGYTGPKPWRLTYYGPDGKEHNPQFATKGEAEVRLTQIEGSKLVGAFIDPKQAETPFLDVVELYKGALIVSDKTRESYMASLNAWVVPRFESYQIGAIDVNEVKQFMAAIFAAGRSYSCAKNAMGVLRRVLDTAVDARMLVANPAASVKLPKGKAKQARTKRRQATVFLTLDEVTRLAAAMTREHYGLLVLFTAFTGLRAGEIAGLRVGDLDMLGLKVHVRRAIQTSKGKLVEGLPKNGEERTVKLAPFLKDETAAYIATAGLRRNDWLFASPRGGAMDHSNFYRREYKPAVERADLPAGLTFHHLRHTNASWLIAQKITAKALQIHLGHSSYDITMDIYGHLFDDYDEEIGDALQNVWSKAEPDYRRTKADNVVALGL